MPRTKEKQAVEDYRALDIRGLRRDGVLLPGHSCNWQWSRDGKVMASIGLIVESLNRLRLRYQSSSYGRAPVQHDYPVSITWTSCHLGGDRPWFLCPCCRRRVAKLYSADVFACRHCVRLNYRSQQTSKRDRACARSWELRRALGCDEGFLSLPAQLIAKPNGMHWKTFERKIQQIKRVDAQAMADAVVVISSLERRFERAESQYKK